MVQGYKMFDFDVARAAYELRERNPRMKNTEIAREIGMTGTAGSKTVGKWLANPARFSPFLDEVALVRAQREKEVYDNLSIYEYFTYWDRAYEEIMAEEGTNRYDSKKTLAKYASVLGIDERSVGANARRVRASMARSTA